MENVYVCVCLCVLLWTRHKTSDTQQVLLFTFAAYLNLLFVCERKKSEKKRMWPQCSIAAALFRPHSNLTLHNTQVTYLQHQQRARELISLSQAFTCSFSLSVRDFSFSFSFSFANSFFLRARLLFCSLYLIQQLTVDCCCCWSKLHFLFRSLASFPACDLSQLSKRAQKLNQIMLAA